MLIKEFRVALPLSVEEYQRAQLYAVAQASKNETGGGDGVEVLKNEPYDDPAQPGGRGQYTLKIYHLKTKAPKLLRAIAPEGSLEVQEEAWNAYPYCRTVISNPKYMKEKFSLVVETWHKPGKGELENVHELSPEKLRKRDVVMINFAEDPAQYGHKREEWSDVSKYQSKQTGRGPWAPDWISRDPEPVMTCYKLVTIEFKWFGLQSIVESLVQKFELKLFYKMHRELVCWMDDWYPLTMEDIRRIEAETKEQLEQQRKEAEVRGITAEDVDSG